MGPDDVLLSIPGIGTVVAIVLRAAIGDARDFEDASTFRAYAGGGAAKGSMIVTPS